MGRLLDPDRRRQAQAERAARQDALLRAARELLLDRPPTELTLEALDRSAGLRQGAASMYFGSLEGVLVRIAREALDDWAGALEERLGAESGEASPERLAALLQESLRDRALLRRLVAILPILLERRSVEMENLLDFETWRLVRARAVAARLEERWPLPGPDGGLRLLDRALRLAAAVEPLIRPPSGLALAAADPALAPLYPDGEEELGDLLLAVVRSAVVTPPGGE